MKVNSDKKHKFGYIAPDTVPIDITDADLLSKYNREVIEFAQKLKGQHKKEAENGEVTHTFSDEYYLKYAQRYVANQKYAQGNSHLSLSLYRVNNNNPDPLWSQYSYEEIIAMADNGVNVPADVLGWAKAQQDSDTTAYVIIAEGAENDDNSSTSEVAGQSDINQLRAQAQEYVTRANKQQKKAQQEAQIIQENIENAKNQKNSYENSINNRKQSALNKISELNFLGQKRQTGTISQSENFKYNQLKQELDNDSFEDEQLKNEGAQLDKFLDSIDTFNDSEQVALKLSSEAKDAGINLGQLNKTYTDNNITHAVNNFQKTTGLLENLMEGISSDKISDITILKSKDFEKESLDIGKIIDDKKDSLVEQNIETKQTQVQIEKNPSQANKTAGSAILSNDAYAKDNNNQVNNDKKVLNSETSDLENAKTEAGYGLDISKGTSVVGMGTGIAGMGSAIYSAATVSFKVMASVVIPSNLATTALTLASIANLALKNSNVEKTNELTSKNSKILSSEIKTLEKAQSAAIKAHESNVALGEMLYNQAKELQQQSQAYILERLTQSQEDNKSNQTVNNNNQKSENNDNNDNNPIVNENNAQEITIEDPYEGQKNSLSAQLDNLAILDSKTFDPVKKPLKRVDTADMNAAKSVNALSRQSEQLDKTNDNNKKQSLVAAAAGVTSMAVGGLGLIKAHLFQNVGFAQIAAANASVPFSAGLYAMGVRNVVEGVTGQIVSALTLATGVAEGVTAAGGLLLSNKVKGDIKSNKSDVKSISKANKQTRKEYLKIKKMIAKSKQAKVQTFEVEQNSQSAQSTDEGSNNVSTFQEQQNSIKNNNEKNQNLPLKQNQNNDKLEVQYPKTSKIDLSDENKINQINNFKTPKTNEKVQNKQQISNKQMKQDIGIQNGIQQDKKNQPNNSIENQKSPTVKSEKTRQNQNADKDKDKDTVGSKVAGMNKLPQNKVQKDKTKTTENKQKITKKEEDKAKKQLNNQSKKVENNEQKIAKNDEKITKNAQKNSKNVIKKPENEKNEKKLLETKNLKLENKNNPIENDKVNQKQKIKNNNENKREISEIKNNKDEKAPKEVDKSKNQSNIKLAKKSPIRNENDKNIEIPEQIAEKSPNKMQRVNTKNNKLVENNIDIKPNENKTEKQNLEQENDSKNQQNRIMDKEKQPIERMENRLINNPLQKNIQILNKAPQPLQKTLLTKEDDKKEPINNLQNKGLILFRKQEQNILMPSLNNQEQIDKPQLKIENSKEDKNNDEKSNNKPGIVKNLDKKKGLKVENDKNVKNNRTLNSDFAKKEQEDEKLKKESDKKSENKKEQLRLENKKKEENEKLKKEEQDRKIKADEIQKILIQNSQNRNIAAQKSAIVDEIELIVNKNDNFEDKNPQETNTIVSAQMDTINSLKQKVDSLSFANHKMAASATVNASFKNKLETDDKAEKRLTRFNNDSILESKKKRKKVVAISQAFGGGVKG